MVLLFCGVVLVFYNRAGPPRYYAPIGLESDDSLTSNEAYVEFLALKSQFHALTTNLCHVMDLKADECLPELKKFQLAITNSDKCSQCFYDSAKKPRKIFYHTFFHFNSNDKNMLRMMNLHIMSFLATQNLCCAKLIVWTLDGFSSDVINQTRKLFDKYAKSDNFEIREFNIADLCFYGVAFNDTGRFSSFQTHPVCDNTKRLTSMDQIGLSDFVRFFGKYFFIS
jgi:hypothetical protein